MRAVVQRVSRASVAVEGRLVGAINVGLVVLVGVRNEDDDDDVARLADKLLNLRIFADSSGKMNLSVQEVGGGLLVVSQFTLYADCRKGRRPSFLDAAAPEHANAMYERLLERLRTSGTDVAAGRFGAMMQVELVNDGPATFLLDSR